MLLTQLVIQRKENRSFTKSPQKTNPMCFKHQNERKTFKNLGKVIEENLKIFSLIKHSKTIYKGHIYKINWLR